MKKDKYELRELLDQCSSKDETPEEIKEWEKTPPVGKEYGAASGALRDIEIKVDVSDDQSLEDSVKE